MNRLYILILIGIFSCNQTNQTAEKQPKQRPLKGELHFLLAYNQQMPGDVGFLTNHIVERRLANLLKSDFELFMVQAQHALPIQVDSLQNLIRAEFLKDSQSNEVGATIFIDVAKDAFWVDFKKGDSVMSYADYPSCHKPYILKK